MLMAPNKSSRPAGLLHVQRRRFTGPYFPLQLDVSVQPKFFQIKIAQISLEKQHLVFSIGKNNIPNR